MSYVSEPFKMCNVINSINYVVNGIRYVVSGVNRRGRTERQ